MACTKKFLACLHESSSYLAVDGESLILLCVILGFWQEVYVSYMSLAKHTAFLNS